MSSATADVSTRTVNRSWLRHDFLPLYLRGLLLAARQPTRIIPPVVLPLFFLVIQNGVLGRVVTMPGFPVDEYVAFLLPLPLLMAIATTGSSSGFLVVEVIETGYFDKLLLTPIRRSSVLLSGLAVDGTRVVFQTLLLIGVTVALGGDIVTGFAGVVMLVLLALAFGLAYAGIGLTMALRTGSAEATNSVFVLFFPFVFLSPAFLPRDLLEPWVQVVAAYNPITYVIEGLRAVTVTGFAWTDVFQALVAIAAIAAITLSTSFAALKSRTQQ